MTDYERKIERGLILWLREEKDVKAVEATLDAEGEEESYGYCDTCYGTSAVAKIYVSYRKEDGGWGEVEVGSDSLNFLPTLLPYIDRAN